MKIYDKARWQIDGGIDEKNVIAHFEFMLSWLDEFELLTAYGKDVKNGVIDDEAIISEEMVNHLGQVFLDKYYDEYISLIHYGVKEDKELLEKMYYLLKNNSDES